MNIYRQGDVLITPLNSNYSATKDDKVVSSGVLAYGEVTGHAHRIVKGQAELYQTIAGLMFLKVLSEFATLGHEEHEDINLPMGDYEVKQQREFDWFTEEVRRVAD